MAKGSHKRLSRSERDHLGCISGLISIFDFRQGRSTRRLISDRRRGNDKPPLDVSHQRGTLDCPTGCNQQHAEDNTCIHTLMVGNEGRRKNIELGKTSVKTLMDEELTKVQKSKKRFPNPVLEQIRQDLEMQGSFENGTMQSNSTSRLDSHTSKIEIFPLVEELCSLNAHDIDIATYQKIKQLGRKHSALEEKFGEALKAFLNQKFTEAKQHNRDGVHRSNDLTDALDILNANKELFLKLLQDPNSPLMKHIEDLRTAQSEKLTKIESCKVLGSQIADKECHSGEALERHDRLQNQGRHHKFFRRKDKSRDKTPPKTNDVNGDTSNTIVILKPSQSPQQSHFSLGDIKRKLQSTIGESRKERHWIFKDRISHKSQASTTSSKSSNPSETTHEIPRGCRTIEKRGKTKESMLQQKESSIYKEAKKHLADMLSSGDEAEDFTVTQVPRPLERILSSAEYYSSSPRFSPGRSIKSSPRPEPAGSSLKDNSICTTGHTTPVKKELPANHSGSPRHDTEDSHEPEAELEKPNLISEFEGTKVDDTTEQDESVENHFILEEDMKIEEMTEVVCVEDNVSRELHSFTEIEIESYEENSTGHSIQISSEEKTQLLQVPESFSAGPIIICNNQTADNLYDKPDRPSPVSVLEPPFSDDDVSPSDIIAQNGESIQPRRLCLEEHEDSAETSLDQEICLRTSTRNSDSNFEYVKKVIEASGLSCDELKGSCPFSDPPLNPSLFDEVEAPNRLFSDDQKLLFDCVNEVLTKIYERYFGHSPWISFVKTETRPIPRGKNFLREVLEGIDECLLPPGPRTLDQLVGKDMAKDKTWMDVRLHAEEICFEIEDAIFDKIMEESILELWD
ncbi:hypothetical protein H6P81_017141 [Aristolochia fimbriata]|uniref:DUF4378 domain-containing protein n=1 Tax=Aristolochia fimbriata TaxID=158543 RepID=A0AAV7E0D4_ARIFI|nr:hypothetical protein H6P81_017141 [Aristolochia fimbriata]